MSTGVAIAVAAGALVLVFIITKKQEAATVSRANSIVAGKQGAKLGAGDVFAIGLTAGATYLGGAKGGATVAGLTGLRL